MSGATESIDEVLAALERAPAIIVPLVLQTPEKHRKRRPEPTKWSVHEHAVHLAEVHPLFTARLERMLTEDNVVITPYDPSNDDKDGALLKLDLEAALDRFARDRASLVSRLRALSPEQWLREAEHPEFVPYTIATMFRHLALHDFLHAYRIEELALKPAWKE